MIQAEAIYHVTANNKILRRTYSETADRARGLAYFLKKKGFRRVGILCPNTPAFLESIFGIAAAGSMNVGAFPTKKALMKRARWLIRGGTQL
jgi:acyl-CoA synthetase (AMP-forming)/AMP-acid ligase II